MVSCKQFVILALSGSTMAFPAVFKRDWKYGQGRWHGGWGSGRTWSDVAYTWETVTETEEAPAATAAPITTTTADDVPVVTVTATYGYTPVFTYSAAPVVTSSAAPVVTSTAAPVVATTASATTASSAPAAAGTGYMAFVNTWRGKTNPKNPLTQDSKLEANALKTVKDSNGVMVHELNPGSMAQVLAPGNTNNFENVYVGGWLCEVPTLPGLNGQCATFAQGWDHSNGETGHADILTSTSYTKIGCALYAGIWACDLA